MLFVLHGVAFGMRVDAINVVRMDVVLVVGVPAVLEDDDAG